MHPDNKHIMYPLGDRICILNYETNKQEFLCGHTNVISCVRISPSGKLVASGQISHMGFRSYTIVWDWEKRAEILRHDLHKVYIQALSFSSNDKYLISLGGEDDRTVAVYNLQKKY